MKEKGDRERIEEEGGREGEEGGGRSGEGGREGEEGGGRRGEGGRRYERGKRADGRLEGGRKRVMARPARPTSLHSRLSTPVHVCTVQCTTRRHLLNRKASNKVQHCNTYAATCISSINETMDNTELHYVT